MLAVSLGVGAFTHYFSYQAFQASLKSATTESDLDTLFKDNLGKIVLIFGLFATCTAGFLQTLKDSRKSLNDLKYSMTQLLTLAKEAEGKESDPAIMNRLRCQAEMVMSLALVLSEKVATVQRASFYRSFVGFVTIEFITRFLKIKWKQL